MSKGFQNCQFKHTCQVLSAKASSNVPWNELYNDSSPCHVVVRWRRFSVHYCDQVMVPCDHRQNVSRTQNPSGVSWTICFYVDESLPTTLVQELAANRRLATPNSILNDRVWMEHAQWNGPKFPNWNVIHIKYQYRETIIILLRNSIISNRIFCKTAECY